MYVYYKLKETMKMLPHRYHEIAS